MEEEEREREVERRSRQGGSPVRRRTPDILAAQAAAVVPLPGETFATQSGLAFLLLSQAAHVKC